MNISRIAFLQFLVLAVAGCGTTVERATKSPTLAAPITSVSVVYVSAIENKAARPSLGTLLGSPYPVANLNSGGGVMKDAQDLGTHILQAIPTALKSAGAALPHKTYALASRPTTISELESAVASQVGGSPVLLIQPIAARMECPGSCFVFTLDVQLIGSDISTPLWSATLVAPPRASRFNDFSLPGQSVAETLVAQLKKDGVIN